MSATLIPASARAVPQLAVHAQQYTSAWPSDFCNAECLKLKPSLKLLPCVSPTYALLLAMAVQLGIAFYLGFVN